MTVPQREALGTRVSQAPALLLESPGRHSLSGGRVREDLPETKATRHVGGVQRPSEGFTHLCLPGSQPHPPLARHFLLLLSLSSSFPTLQQPPSFLPGPLRLPMCQGGPRAPRLAEEPAVLPASAPVPAQRSAPHWLVLSISIYLLLE